MTQATLPAVASRKERIEGSLDKNVTSSIGVSASVGGLAFKNMDEVMNFAKLMALSDVAVPKHIRDNPGACLAVTIQAIEWRMSPYAVANKSYVVNDRLCFESQLIHAVIEQRAPLAGRLRCRYTGEGEQRRCIVWATVKGESDPMEYQSPETGKIFPKNSPLWKSKPDLQLFYNASRDWARMYFPDVILGVYAEDEIDASRNTTSDVPRIDKPGASGLAARLGVGQSPESGPVAVHEAVVDQGETTPSQSGIDQLQQADTAPQEQQQPEPATQTQAPAPDLSDYATFVNACEELAKAGNVPPEQFDKGFGAALMLIGKKGKGKDSTLEWRKKTYAAIQAGKLDWATGKVNA